MDGRGWFGAEAGSFLMRSCRSSRYASHADTKFGRCFSCFTFFTRRDGTGEAPDVTIEGDVWANCRAVLGGAEELEILPRKASAESETRRRRI